MSIVNTSNLNANWFDVLEIWSDLANWTSYKTTERKLLRQIRMFAIVLWAEKDWLIAAYPSQRKKIEDFMATSEAISIVADIANTTKHQTITKKKRSTAIEVDLFGYISLSNGAARRLYYFRNLDGRHVEIMKILRSALDSLEGFRNTLRANKYNV